MNYVCGFYFSWDLSEFLLIKKTHTEWQKGKWNGVGGKIERYTEFKSQPGIRYYDSEYTDVNGNVGKVIPVPAGGVQVAMDLEETPHESMVREFHEETGLPTKERDWRCFYVEDWITGPDSKIGTKVYYFAAFGDYTKLPERVQLNGGLSEEEAVRENIEIVKTHTLIDLYWEPERYIWNLRFLIPMLIFNVKSGFFHKLNPQGVNSK